ncbi:hypothetical protein Leryth_018896 [Lithospermum erythrorhizon]|nr:hypothetical protein Leryth_018896 [Lithospermum erythrorhizon]
MLQKTLESMKDVTYCPRCETICIEDEDQHAQCTKCYFSFCSLCKEPATCWSCMYVTEMKLLILQKGQNSSLIEGWSKIPEKEMINRAPQCQRVNQASGRQCPSLFLLPCNKAFDGYDHFSSAGTCDLFPPEAIQMWEERINDRQIVGQLQAGLIRNYGRPCPNCKQINAKVGNNNHIFCWACQNHYCYLCGKMVRRSTQHYGPKGCKQHTQE